MDDLALLTGYALLAAVSVLGALSAHRAADRAARAASSLLQSRGRLVALEHSCDAIDTKLRRLAGRVYVRERAPKCDDDWHRTDHTAATMCPSCREAWEPGPPLNEAQKSEIRSRLRAQNGLPPRPRLEKPE